MPKVPGRAPALRALGREYEVLIENVVRHAALAEADTSRSDRACRRSNASVLHPLPSAMTSLNR
jgi:hypothetical protein